MSKKRVLNTFKIVILFSALFHLSLLFIYSIIKGDFIYMNYFNILDIDLFFPQVIVGTTSQVLSLLTMIILFTVVYVWFSKD